MTRLLLIIVLIVVVHSIDLPKRRVTADIDCVECHTPDLTTYGKYVRCWQDKSP